MSEIFGRLGGPRDDKQPQESGAADDTRPSPRAGRWLRRHLAGGGVALTTVVDGAFRASTLTGVLVASIDPLLFLVSIELDSQMETWIRTSGVFGLSILSFRQQFLADRFAGLAPLASASFRGIDHFTAATGAPLLAESIGWADCRVEQELETGDHVSFVGRAVAVGRGHGADEEPLVYYVNRYLHLR